MAINITKNQALGFNTSEPCQCGGVYCQPWNDDDVIYTQGTITEATGDNLIHNDLWDLTAGASFPDGWRQVNTRIYGMQLASPTDYAVSNKLNLQAGVYYSIYTDIVGYHYDSIDSLLSVTFYNGHQLDMPGDQTGNYANGDTILILSCPLNDKIFTITSIVYNGTPDTTTINVTETTVAETGTLVSVIKNPVTTGLPNLGYAVYLNGQNLTSAAPTPGVYLFNWLYTTNSVTNDYLKVAANDTDILVVINEIRVTAMSRVGISVYTNNTLVHQFDNPTSLVSYYPTNGPLVPTYADNSTGNASLDAPTILWQAIINLATFSGREYGCGNIGFYDSTLFLNSIFNGTFDTDLSGWVAGNYWSWNSNKALYNPPGGTYTPGTLSQTVTVMAGVYTLQFDIANFTFGDRCELHYIINGGTDINAGNYSNGTNTVAIDASAYTGLVTIEIIFAEHIQSNDSFTVDNVTLTGNTPDTNNVSECINIQTSHTCTLLLTGINNDNAFGFDYTHGFKHNLRIEAKKDVTAYPETREQYTFSDNSHSLMYAKTDREETVYITDAPVYVHDCIRIIRLHDTFEIDGSLYIANSDYSLNRRKTSKLKQASFTAIAQDGIASNYPCS